jgi:curved DNA-binding protein
VEYKDYYKIIGLEKSASKDELKKQYRKLARKYHPDVNTTDKNAEARFAEISEAYEVLSNEEKRQKYDTLGSDWERYTNTPHTDSFDWSKYAYAQARQEKNAGVQWEDIFGPQSGNSDFFSSIFGQESGTRRGTRSAGHGSDLRAELAISLEDAYTGGVKIIAVGNRNIRLRLKPGIWDNQTIKVAGKGSPGFNGIPNGDLYLSFAIRPHKDYRLEGVDLFRDLPLSVYSAMLGATIQLHTISGSFLVTIRPETKQGTVLKLKAKGFPVYGKPEKQGDLYLRVMLNFPEKLTSYEKKLWRELAALRKEPLEAEKAVP